MTDRRLRAAVAALSALGAGVAAYLTAAHLTHTQVACVTGGCETVQSSRYAELAGVPVAALGLAGYVALALTAASGRELARAAGAFLAVSAFAFAAYLLYVQVAVLDALCQWCLTSDAALALLVPATLLRLRGPTASRAARPGAGSAGRAPRPPARGRARRAGRALPRR